MAAHREHTSSRREYGWRDLYTQRYLLAGPRRGVLSLGIGVHRPGDHGRSPLAQAILILAAVVFCFVLAVPVLAFIRWLF